MHIAGIIAEYNPFHCGHAHHIAMTRQAGASHIVCVMSGDYVQRGEGAIINKWARARAAIACGADLVLELPLTWALSPAHRFSSGGIFMLNALGCVNTVSFGSESGNINVIGKAVEVLSKTETQNLLLQHIKQGKSYAAAAEAAMRLIAPDCAGVLATANDILGVEYLSAMARIGSIMKPLAIQRMEGGLGYRAEILRQKMRDGNENVALYLPLESAKIFQEEAANKKILIKPGEKAVMARLLAMRPNDFAALPEVREGLENRLYRAARKTNTLNEFYNAVKTRRFTHASLKRIVMNALLGIHKADWMESPPYLHVLAMGERAPEILRIARKTAKLPIIHHAAQIRKLDKPAQEMFALERRAGNIWNMLC